MFCKLHNTLFLLKHGCSKCREAWVNGPWETKEKEWLNKLDEIGEKAQELANHAARLEQDNKSLNRSTEHMTKTLGLERQAREEAEATVRRHETKLKAVSVGYRNALGREENLKKQIEVVIVERGEWMERCRLAEKTRCDVCGMDPCGCGSDISHIDRDYLIERLREKGLMDEKRKVRGWVGPGDERSWEVHDSECPIWPDGNQQKCDCGGGQTNYNHPFTKQIITGYPAPGDRLELHCRGCPVWSMSNGPCSCEHCVLCGEEKCTCKMDCL